MGKTDRKIAKTLSLSQECMDLLRLLTKATGVSASDIVERGVRLEALGDDNKRLIDVYLARQRLSLEVNEDDVDLRLVDDDDE